MKVARIPPVVAAKEILGLAQLPTGDLTPDHMEHFFGAWSGATLVGVVGIEPYGTMALLRSLAVVATQRGSGVGSALLGQAEQYAAEKGIGSIFLLTTTAPAYFEKRGYCAISRETVPEAIRSTKEFASLCPSSAVLMVKHLWAQLAVGPWKISSSALLARIPGPPSPKWPEGAHHVVALSHGTMSLELYAPKGTDPQTPHRQDELYLIQSGRGELVVENVRHACSAGDAFFISAGVEHRFERFSDDFTTWVVFWGPQGGER